MNIMKIKLLYARIMKIIKFIEFHLRIMKFITIQLFHFRIIQNHEIHRITCQNKENQEKK